jgi:2-hydroxychromene-2-carboxylate isomerase
MSRATPIGDVLARRVLPRAVVAQSRIDWPARVGAAARRRLGRPGRVELFFAFDDPCSAVAVIELAERTGGRGAELALLPVVRRGIPRDPAVGLKRRYAITDARRLGARSGLTLSRGQPLDPDLLAFLAEWVSLTPPGPALTGFCVQAMRELWFNSDGPVPRVELAALWREQLGSEPPLGGTSHGVQRNERRMRRRGPYDTPAAWVHGQWFFAHDRLSQIEHRLDELGWSAAA